MSYRDREKSTNLIGGSTKPAALPIVAAPLESLTGVEQLLLTATSISSLFTNSVTGEASKATYKVPINLILLTPLGTSMIVGGLAIAPLLNRIEI